MSRRTLKYIVIAVVSLTLIGGFARSYWWWTHPTLLSDSGMGASGSSAPQPVATAVTHVGIAGEPWRKPFGNPPEKVEQVTLHGARAHFRVNSAHARVAFFICRATEPDSAIGVVNDALSHYCTAVRPLHDGTLLRYGSPEYIVATVTPTKPGRFNIDYVTLDYSRPHFYKQHGKDDVSVEYSMKVTD